MDASQESWLLKPSIGRVSLVCVTDRHPSCHYSFFPTPKEGFLWHQRSKCSCKWKHCQADTHTIMHLLWTSIIISRLFGTCLSCMNSIYKRLFCGHVLAVYEWLYTQYNVYSTGARPSVVTYSDAVGPRCQCYYYNFFLQRKFRADTSNNTRNIHQQPMEIWTESLSSLHKLLSIYV